MVNDILLSIAQLLEEVGVLAVAAFGGGFLGDIIKKKIDAKDKTKDIMGRLDVLEETFKNHTESIALITDTLAATSYTILSQRLEHYLSKGYADAQDRREIEILRVAYKSHGWNGDMDARVEAFNKLPLAPKFDYEERESMKENWLSS